MQLLLLSDSCKAAVCFARAIRLNLLSDSQPPRRAILLAPVLQAGKQRDACFSVDRRGTSWMQAEATEATAVFACPNVSNLSWQLAPPKMRRCLSKLPALCCKRQSAPTLL